MCTSTERAISCRAMEPGCNPARRRYSRSSCEDQACTDAARARRTSLSTSCLARGSRAQASRRVCKQRGGSSCLQAAEIAMRRHCCLRSRSRVVHRGRLESEVRGVVTARDAGEACAVVNPDGEPLGIERGNVAPADEDAAGDNIDADVPKGAEDDGTVDGGRLPHTDDERAVSTRTRQRFRSTGIV